jgi:hypothetical protein
MLSPRRVIVVLVLSLLAVPGLRCRQAEDPKPTANSDAPPSHGDSIRYCEEVESLAKANPGNPRIFADVSSGTESGPPQWREFRNEAERQAQDTGENLNENALVWSRDKRVVLVRFTYQSPSRDWAHFVDYCFSQDGTLQRAHSELRTFYGNVRKVRDVVNGGEGRFVEARSEVFDLASGKAIKPPDNFEDQEVPLVKSVGELPFIRLLGAV